MVRPLSVSAPPRTFWALVSGILPCRARPAARAPSHDTAGLQSPRCAGARSGSWPSGYLC